MQSRRKEGLVEVLFFCQHSYIAIFVKGILHTGFGFWKKQDQVSFGSHETCFLRVERQCFFLPSHICMLAMLEVRRSASHGCGGQLARKKLALKRRTMLSALTSALNPFISFWASVSPHLGSSGAGLCLPLILIHLALHCTILPRWKRHQMDR